MILLSTAMQEGIIILVVGLFIVFLSLILLFIVFQYIVPFFIGAAVKRKPKSSVANSDNTETAKEYEIGEEMAAISTAIYMFLEEAHDEENAIITISNASKNYSPWSSKIYVTHNLHHR